MGYGGLLEALGEKWTKNPYRPSKQNIADYEDWQKQDIRSLYRTTPIPGKEWAGYGYEGPGLGFSAAEMEGKFGEGRDLSAGAAATSRQRLSDYYRSPGGFGLRSAQYGRALQREN